LIVIIIHISVRSLRIENGTIMNSKLKPQDILVMVKILLLDKNPWSIGSLAESIELSKSETHSAIKRCDIAGLYNPISKTPIKSSLEEFIFHGVKYAFPVVPGSISRGIPTAHSAKPMSEFVESADSDMYVWPYEYGKVRGISIEPLYVSVPRAALKDPKLYELLSLIDCLRTGKARETTIAEKEIRKIIK